jgi:hypothetical protein
MQLRFNQLAPWCVALLVLASACDETPPDSGERIFVAEGINAADAAVRDAPVLEITKTCEAEQWEDVIDVEGYSCIINNMGATVCHHMYGDWSFEEAKKHCDDRGVGEACMSEQNKFCNRDDQLESCTQHRPGDREVWIFQQIPEEICLNFVGDTHIRKPIAGWPVEPETIDNWDGTYYVSPLDGMESDAAVDVDADAGADSGN